jgi:hypothetical protein
VLEEFLGRPEVHKRMQLDYVVLELDTDRMTNGKAIYDRMKADRKGGLPWLIVVDDAGKELITGIGPKGNIGAPVQPEECEHFVAMLRATKQRLTDDDVQTIAAELEAHAKPKRRK